MTTHDTIVCAWLLTIVYFHDNVLWCRVTDIVTTGVAIVTRVRLQGYSLQVITGEREPQVKDNRTTIF